jgi:hypothetical protein
MTESTPSTTSTLSLFSVPGPFTVLQGTPGDGMVNTICASSSASSLPKLNVERMMERVRLQQQSQSFEQLPSTSTSTSAPSCSSTILPTNISSNVNENGDALFATATTVDDFETITKIIQQQQTSQTQDDNDEYEISNSNHSDNKDKDKKKVGGEEESNHNDNNNNNNANDENDDAVSIQQWTIHCRRQRSLQLKHVLETYPSLLLPRSRSGPACSSTSNNSSDAPLSQQHHHQQQQQQQQQQQDSLDRFAWWQRNGGELAVFATPTIHYPLVVKVK